jgi:tRNA threonylcarbamoyladenosine biosynthesis protein TsaE
VSTIHIDNESEATTELIAQVLAPHLAPGDLLVLSGDLGAGKTFFARALLYALGLERDERVPSPTFTLIHEYEVRLHVLHADLYRLQSADEVQHLGMLERRQQGALLVVEWGRPFAAELGADAVYLDFPLAPRRLVLTADGPRGTDLLSGLRKSYVGVGLRYDG